MASNPCAALMHDMGEGVTANEGHVARLLNPSLELTGNLSLASPCLNSDQVDNMTSKWHIYMTK